ncbi:CPBP family intramembrane glutamic endopeptidase [Paenibacillus endoradicis]|uniref:CPBP family intramembrane glutamic endopeptidase n=1 Tax=Paenibacillus endoradicis TaxID=2972487 RepID=UPI002158E4F9|nr:CPBP family intramembrane glutamic endopeptidase [Paenibacillus endoradicis]MCR8657657.1 CPBP family intramembrane metalloprotease [Paenibacillus endoradicis]
MFESGAVSKSYYADAWQVWLNALLGMICLIIFLNIALRGKLKIVEIADPLHEEIIPSKRQGRLVVLFTLLGAVAATALLPYMMSVIKDGWIELPLPLAGKAAITVIQAALMTLVASTFGLMLASKVGLDAPLLRYWLYGGNKVNVSFGWLGIGALGSLLGTMVIVLMEKELFQPRLPQVFSEPSVALWKGALTFLYGGVVEEILLRLFVMSLIVWVFTRVGGKRSPIPSIYYVLAIVLAAILFGLAHLPATMSLFGELTPLLVIRAILSNGLLGVWFGYLYWKKGLEYAIVAHMFADIFLHVVLAAWLT